MTTPSTTFSCTPLTGVPARVRSQPACRRQFPVFSVLAALAVVTGSPIRAAAQTPSTERASALRADGKLDEALDVLRTASREVKKSFGEESPQLLPINELAAAILVDKGDFDTAEPLLAKAIATRQRLVDDGRSVYAAELVSSLMTLARLQAQAKRYPDAAATAQRALSLLDRIAGPGSPEAATICTTLESTLDTLDDFLGPADKATLDAREGAAATFASLGLLRSAVEQRRKLLTGARSRGADGAAESYAAAERLCGLMLAAGLAAEAIPIAEEAVHLAQTASVPLSPPGMRLVANLQLADGRLIEADASFKAAIDAVQSTKGALPIASSCDRLQRLLIDVRRGRVETLPAWFDAELKLLMSATPADRDAAAAAVAVAAEILSARGQTAAAAEQLTRAVALAASAKTPSAATVADLSGRLAAALLAAGKPEAALDAAKKALATAEKALGPGDPPVSFLRIVLAAALHAQHAQGTDDAATKALLDALRRDVPRPDDDREAVIVSVVDQLAAARPDEPIRDTFIEARQRQFGDGHRHVGMALSLLAEARLAAGDWASATDFFSRALAVFRTSLEDEHPEVAATMVLVAQAQLCGGDAARAADTAAEALARWERIAGDTHPGTLAAVEVLARARLQAGDRTAAQPLLERLCGNGTTFSDVRQADHLVHLAAVVLPGDRERAQESLERAVSLPCWRPDADLPPGARPAMALTAARAAHVYTLLGLDDRAAEALRQARSWATTTAHSKDLLGQVERLAESGDLTPDS